MALCNFIFPRKKIKFTEKEMKNPIQEPELTKNTLYAAAKKLLATPDLEPTAKSISLLSQHNHARTRNLRFCSFCSSNFPNSLSLKLLRVYASNNPRFEDNVREKAIKGLGDLLSNRKNREEPLLEFFVVQELAHLLVTCLDEQGTEEGMFQILSQVTYHVAFEIFSCHNGVWFELGEFISSRAEPEFKKAVSVFKSLSIPLHEDAFMIPLLKNLLPQILKWLDLSRLGRENNWVLAFEGAFCLAIHLLETKRVDLVGNIAYQMMKSVTELVNRGVVEEEELVRRAFMEVETQVRKQREWYCVTEHRFVSGLIRRMNKIQGLENETKMVLWRMQYDLDKHMSKWSEKFADDEEDWLNQCFRIESSG